MQPSRGGTASSLLPPRSDKMGWREVKEVPMHMAEITFHLVPTRLQAEPKKYCCWGKEECVFHSFELTEGQITRILAAPQLLSWVSPLPFQVPGAMDTVDVFRMSLFFKNKGLQTNEV